MDKTASQYALGWSPQELERLDMQAIVYEAATRNFLARIGLAPGMRILDAGCGTGAVAFLVADLTGGRSEIIGADISLEAIAIANRKSTDLNLDSVRFVEGDPAIMTFDEPFDAIVGRLILMHYPDAVQALSRLSKHLKPGGIMAFQEADYSGIRFSEPMPLCSKCLHWITTAFSRLGVEAEMGMKLYKTFIKAGLPPPFLMHAAEVGGGAGFVGYEMAAALVATLAPALERLGVVGPDEIVPDTLARRLREEVTSASGVVVLPPLIGAWSRLPMGQRG